MNNYDKSTVQTSAKIRSVTQTVGVSIRMLCVQRKQTDSSSSSSSTNSDDDGYSSYSS